MKKFCLGLFAVAFALVGQAASAETIVPLFDFSDGGLRFGTQGNLSFVGNFDVYKPEGSPLNLAGAIGSIDGSWTIGAVNNGTAQVTGGPQDFVLNLNGASIKASLTLNEIGVQEISLPGGRKSTAGYVTGLLSGWSPVSGSDANLNGLIGFPSDDVVISFQFTPAKALSTLVAGTYTAAYSGSVSAVPEPSTITALASLGLLGLVWAWRRRK